jgi:predicted GNAT family acetyltransferase
VDEADRFHSALCGVFESIVTGLDGGTFDRRDGYLLCLCPALPLPQFTGVWADADEESARALPAAVAEVERRALPFSLQTRTGRTPGAEREAERLGLSLVDEMPAMFAREGAVGSAHAEDLVIERLASDDAAGFETALEVAAAGFQAPAEFVAPLYSPTLAATMGWSLYLGRVGGAAVSTAVGWVRDGLTFIGSVATPPEWRRRGYAAAVTARACDDGFRAGAEAAFLQSSRQAHAIYRRLGFVDVMTYRLFLRMPGEAARG